MKIHRNNTDMADTDTDTAYTRKSILPFIEITGRHFCLE